ncbi:hypothetical protein BDV26DRAFT_268287 [Aspergillus bertholletiae]|uniref:Uncharacterized protein n=1 Tax=Aspergillus bertholletiae TaxID=1226010 RepID=A0A5N7AZE5_9EURO|nr:hypothetical protein BDV26DRAFT_268287 [Aspergillus bertholletiae]
MVIDERSLKSIIACPEPGSKDRFMPPDGFVGMVDRWYNPERKDSNSRYSGFMRVRIRSLWWLYINLSRQVMEELCPSVPLEFVPFYDGGYGEAHDEEGIRHNLPRRPADLSSRRND